MSAQESVSVSLLYIFMHRGNGGIIRCSSSVGLHRPKTCWRNHLLLYERSVTSTQEGTALTGDCVDLHDHLEDVQTSQVGDTLNEEDPTGSHTDRSKYNTNNRNVCK